jgi:hypothetical protein
VHGAYIIIDSVVQACQSESLNFPRRFQLPYARILRGVDVGFVVFMATVMRGVEDGRAEDGRTFWMSFSWASTSIAPRLSTKLAAVTTQSRPVAESSLSGAISRANRRDRE